MENSDRPLPDVADVAGHLAERLDALGQAYAFGGAIALGYWGEPRGTLDVDLTLFVPPEQPTACVRLLHELGCEVEGSRAVQSLQERGFCMARFQQTRVDVFVPTIAFYDAARQRRRKVLLGQQAIMVWDAETLCVFKMMFLRRKDLADVAQVLRVQGHLQRTVHVSLVPTRTTAGREVLLQA
jgi:hypothetical protein